MTITKETATVYRGGGRRYLTRKAAVKAEAVAIIKAKYPSERDDPECGGGFHWTSLPRADVMFRRVYRLVIAASSMTDSPLSGKPAAKFPEPAIGPPSISDIRDRGGENSGGVAVPAPLSDERILHLWDTHVGYETSGWGEPLSNKDKIAFARAVLAAPGVALPDGGQTV